MQIVPATGKRLARSLGIRKFSTGKLTDPETNVKLGTFYFKGLVNQFGGEHFALASYNAGENRVERWIANAVRCRRTSSSTTSRSRDAALREEDPRHGRGLPPALRRPPPLVRQLSSSCGRARVGGAGSSAA
jgi:hypothetical protein